jgi:cytochrome d ubiquinol oxidase subunit II
LGSGQILLLLTAWAVAQWPFIVYPDIDLHTAVAPAATLTFVLVTLPPGMGLVLPSLRLLFAVFQKDASHGVAPPRQVG